MEYKVVVTEDARGDLNRYLRYLVDELGSVGAAKSVLDDFEETAAQLATMAGVFRLCENPKLRKRNLRRINFRRHRYFLLYHISGECAVVDRMFHQLQDYEAKIK